MVDKDDTAPTGASLLESSAIDPGEVLDLELRLKVLEDKIASGELGWESEYRKKLLVEVEQRIQLRWWATIISLCALILMALFALAGFRVVSGATINGGFNAFNVGLFVTPVISVTAITVMVLIGASKRHNDEGEKVDIPTLLMESIKSLRQ